MPLCLAMNCWAFFLRKNKKNSSFPSFLRRVFSFFFPLKTAALVVPPPQLCECSKRKKTQVYRQTDMYGESTVVGKKKISSSSWQKKAPFCPAEERKRKKSPFPEILTRGKEREKMLFEEKEKEKSLPTVAHIFRSRRRKRKIHFGSGWRSQIFVCSRRRSKRKITNFFSSTRSKKDIFCFSHLEFPISINCSVLSYLLQVEW